MKKLLLILSFIFTFNMHSQNNDGIQLCLDYKKSLKGFISDKDAEDTLNKILDVIGASRNFILVSCDEISNALAITFKGERYILYDKNFIDNIEDMTNDWSGLFILAHEVGHHINGHTRDFLLSSVLDSQSLENKRIEELEADEFAGFIIANLGAEYNEVVRLLNLTSSNTDDSFSTHPSIDKRLKAIKKGFDKFNPKVIVATSKNIPFVPKKSVNIDSENWTFKETFYKINATAYKINELGRELNFFEKNDVDEQIKSWGGADSYRISSSTGYSLDGTKKAKLSVVQSKMGKLSGGGRENTFYLDDFDEMPDITMGELYYMNPKKDVEFKINLAEFGLKQIKDESILPGVIWVTFEYSIDDKYNGKLTASLWGWGLTSNTVSPVERTLKYQLSEAKKKPNNKLRIISVKDDSGKIYYDILRPESVRFLFGKLDKGLTFGEGMMKLERAQESSIVKKEKEEFLNQLKTGNKLILRMDKSAFFEPIPGSVFKSAAPFMKKSYIYEFDLTGSSKALNYK